MIILKGLVRILFLDTQILLHIACMLSAAAVIAAADGGGGGGDDDDNEI